MLRAEADFKSVVIDGALKSRGMVSFAKYMSPKDAEDIRAYLITLARAKQAQDASESTGGR
jgi:quinohemoprotein ethanol dehydrogenase